MNHIEKDKILFISMQLSDGINVGISLLSSKLKEAGYKCDILSVLPDTDVTEVLTKETLSKYIYVGISTTTPQSAKAYKVAQHIKSLLDIPVVMGGPHTTFYPEDSLQSCIDVICIGEGENVIIPLTNSIKNKSSMATVPNIVYKDKEKIFYCPRAAFVKPTEIPAMDLDNWNVNEIVSCRNGWFDYMVGRGCPFSCSYCFNHVSRRLGTKINEYVRLRDPATVISELSEIITKYPVITTISFVDDTFTFNKEWLKKFAELYEKHINLPMVINTTANLVDEEVSSYLKQCKCSLVRIGFETAEESARRLVLNKHILTKTYIDCIKILKKNDIKVLTYNMIGLPNETVEMMKETLKFNVVNKVDVVRISTFIPFKKTLIYSYCMEHKLLTDKTAEITEGYNTGKTILNFSQREKDFVELLNKYFRLYLNSYISENQKDFENLIKKVEDAPLEVALSEEFVLKIAKEEAQIIDDIKAKDGTVYVSKYSESFAFLEEC